MRLSVYTYAMFREAGKLMTSAELLDAIDLAVRAEEGDTCAYLALRKRALQVLRERGTEKPSRVIRKSAAA